MMVISDLQRPDPRKHNLPPFTKGEAERFYNDNFRNKK